MDVHRIAVIGAGSWGTALAISLARTGHDVVLWVRRPALAEAMAETRTNPDYLPGVEVPKAITLTSDLHAAVDDMHVVVIATPSQAVRSVCSQMADALASDAVLVSVAKGIENGSLLTTSAVVDEAVPHIGLDQIGVLYGPSHAEEVARQSPTTVVASAGSPAATEQIRDVFMAPWLRVYSNPDLIGVEIAGSVKNVMAIAAGMSDGIGYGDNAKAAIITRGIAEMRRLGLALGARASTFAGLAGIGDLVVTCTSRHSRNRYVGEQIGRGRTLEEVQAEMKMVAEGVKTTQSVHELTRRCGIEMPITEAIYAILFEGLKPAVAVQDLMTREAKHENWLPDVLQDDDVV